MPFTEEDKTAMRDYVKGWVLKVDY